VLPFGHSARVARPYDGNDGLVLNSRLFLLAFSCLVLAACGGNDSKQDGSAEADEARDPRVGYFRETESRKLNPPLKQYSTAWTKYTQDPDACNKEASRLSAAGASPRKAVQCHLRENQALIDATTSLRAAVSQLDGSYRPACESQIKRFAAALGKVNAARQRVRSDWNAYASSGVVPSRIQQHSTAADQLSQGFLDKDLPGLSNACYTKADREAQGASPEGER
jgi:hypothetical protein